MALKLTVKLADDREFEFTPDNPDLVRWDRYSHKHKFGKASDVPFLWQTFLAWAWLQRNGHVKTTFDQFADVDCMSCEGQEDDEDDMRPTRAVAATG